MSTTTEYSHDSKLRTYRSFDHASRPMNEGTCMAYPCQTANVCIEKGKSGSSGSLVNVVNRRSSIVGIYQHTTTFSVSLSSVTIWCFTLVPSLHREYSCSTNPRERGILGGHRPCRPFLISHDTLLWLFAMHRGLTLVTYRLFVKNAMTISAQWQIAHTMHCSGTVQ